MNITKTDAATPRETQLQGSLTIRSQRDLAWWLEDHFDIDNGWATYVVSLQAELLLAPRRSEHVACAGGEPIFAAGEIRFDAAGSVVEVTNNSTGYCPSEDCWGAVMLTLDSGGIRRPDAFTFVASFRRCPVCGERNLVKEDNYTCAICDAELPSTWNFEA